MSGVTVECGWSDSCSWLFKQKTAYEMRISDWSSDVCSSDLPDSFANSTYYSISAFRFIDGAGSAHAGRWAFEPEAAFGALDKAALASLPTDHLFTDLGARLARGPLRWRMTITVAAPGDITNNATVAWPADRQSIEEIGRAHVELQSLMRISYAVFGLKKK